MRGKERQHKAEERRSRPLNQLLKEVCGKMSQAMQRLAGEGEPVTRVPFTLTSSCWLGSTLCGT